MSGNYLTDFIDSSPYYSQLIHTYNALDFIETHKIELSKEIRDKLNKDPTHSFVIAVRKTGTNILDLTMIRDSFQKIIFSNVKLFRKLRKEIETWFDTVRIYFIRSNNRLFYCTSNKVTEVSFKNACEIFYSFIPELPFTNTELNGEIAFYVNMLKHDLQKRIIAEENRKSE